MNAYLALLINERCDVFFPLPFFPNGIPEPQFELQIQNLAILATLAEFSNVRLDERHQTRIEPMPLR